MMFLLTQNPSCFLTLFFERQTYDGWLLLFLLMLLLLVAASAVVTKAVAVTAWFAGHVIASGGLLLALPLFHLLPLFVFLIW